MQWYYLDEQRQQLETDEEGLRRMAESGELQPDALVWNPSLTEWTPLKRALAGGQVPRAQADQRGTRISPYQAPVSNSRGGNVRTLAGILAQHAGWTRLLGVLTIIGGAFSLPVGAFYIWMGIVLFQIAAQAEEARQSGSEHALAGVMEKTALYFKANAIFLLVVIVLGMFLVGVAVLLGVFAAVAQRGGPALP